MWTLLVLGWAAVAAGVTLTTSSATAQFTGITLGALVAVICSTAGGAAADASRQERRARSTSAAVLRGCGIGWLLVGPLIAMGQVTMAVSLLVVVTSPPVVGRLAAAVHRTLTPPSADPPAPHPATADHDAPGSAPSSPPQVAAGAPGGVAIPRGRQLAELDDAALCRAWRLSYTALERCPVGERLGLVEARQELLDEMERRHPAGFRRWLGTGARPASDPSRYLGQPSPFHP